MGREIAPQSKAYKINADNGKAIVDSHTFIQYGGIS